MSKLYPVYEQFESIQGEGLWTGIPASFIRLQGCNLQCPWCDTKETWLGEAQALSTEQIMAGVQCKHVVVTGGEPLLHDLTELLNALTEAGKQVHIETNGTQKWRDSYPEVAWIAVSPKRESGYRVHFSLQERINEYKFVIDDDFDPDLLADYPFREGAPVLLSPEDVRPEMIEKAVELVFQYPHCRLMLQMHKLIGVR